MFGRELHSVAPRPIPTFTPPYLPCCLYYLYWPDSCLLWGSPVVARGLRLYWKLEVADLIGLMIGSIQIYLSHLTLGRAIRDHRDACVRVSLETHMCCTPTDRAGREGGGLSEPEPMTMPTPPRARTTHTLAVVVVVAVCKYRQ